MVNILVDFDKRILEKWYECKDWWILVYFCFLRIVLILVNLFWWEKYIEL